MKCSLKLVFLLIFTLEIAESLRISERSSVTCGVKVGITGHIVRGNKISRGDFPWMVALMLTETQPPMFFCAGSVISSSFVVSAAHCIQQKQSEEKLFPRDVLAIFGAHNLSNNFEPRRVVDSPKAITIHDDWNPFTTQYDGDLSLLEFEAGTIVFNEFVQPICLWTGIDVPKQQEGTVLGWGKSEDRTRHFQPIPKSLKVTIFSPEDCFLGAKSLVDLSSKRTFCAGSRAGSGVCGGDSGGGMFILEGGDYYLRGIVSSSLVKNSECDISNNAVYTNALKFVQWIQEKVVNVLDERQQYVPGYARQKEKIQAEGDAIGFPFYKSYVLVAGLEPLTI